MKKRTKLAIVGFSEKTRDFAPYDDPEWEIWGCNHVYRFIPRVDVLFEIHKIGELQAKYGPEKWKVYSDWLKSTDAVVYMQDTSEEFPNVKRLPIEQLESEFSYFLEHVEWTGSGVGDRNVTKRERFPYAQFKSTPAYMLAMALLEGFKEIAVYGLDMAIDSEWHFQRMNMSFLLGWARGAGVELTLPETSALLREAGMRLYGYEESQAEKYKPVIDRLGNRIKELDAQLQKMDNQNEEMVNHIFKLQGVIAMLHSYAGDERFNGSRDIVLKDLEEHEKELAQMSERQRVHLSSSMETLGARKEAFDLMDKLGYHNRGEMPEGRS